MGINKCWSKEDLDYLNKNYTVLSKEEISKALNRGWHTIQEYARKRGLFRPKKDFNNRCGSLRPLLNDSNESYYWLGFLMADGYCCEHLNQIVLAIHDNEHAQKYADFLGTKRNIYSNEKSGGFPNKAPTHARVSVAEGGVCQEILEKLDWKKQKTYNPPDVKRLNVFLDDERKFLCFLIGFVDGDGYLRDNQYIKLENHPSWNTIHSFFIDKLQKIGYSTGKIKYSKRGYVSFHINKSALLKLKLKTKEYNLPVLQRKWNKNEITS